MGVVMATFTIDPDNNITVLAQVPAGTDRSTTFSTERELAKLIADWPISRLIDAWNSFAGVAPFDDLKPIKKFTNRKTAVARIWKAAVFSGRNFSGLFPLQLAASCLIGRRLPKIAPLQI
jgi:hypothetical protein